MFPNRFLFFIILLLPSLLSPPFKSGSVDLAVQGTAQSLDKPVFERLAPLLVHSH